MLSKIIELVIFRLAPPATKTPCSPIFPVIVELIIFTMPEAFTANLPQLKIQDVDRYYHILIYFELIIRIFSIARII